MRPIKLEISGLNSYIDKQVIDFKELTSRGLFGIFGKTGSGKSTILDAITIAMYGNISRDTNEYINTSCDSAMIRYQFEIGNKNNKRRYEVERILNKSKSGTANTRSAVLSEIDDSGKKQIIAEKKIPVDKAIVDIVGLTSSDFTRSVVLPQGKFSEFLQLDDSKRREMLERIFNLEKYGKSLNDKVKKRKEQKIKEVDILESNISQFEGTTQDVFDEANDMLENLKASSREMRLNLADIEKKYEEYKEIIEYQQLLIKKQDTKEKLDEQADEIQNDKIKVERSGYAKLINPYIEDVQESEKSISKYSDMLSKLESELTKSIREYESTKIKYEEAQKEKDDKLESLISKKQKYERAITIKEQISELSFKIENLKMKIIDYRNQKESLNKEMIILDERSEKLKKFIKENESKISSIRYSEHFKEKVYKADEIEKEYLRLKNELHDENARVPKLNHELEELKNSFRYVENASSVQKVKLSNFNSKYELLLTKCPTNSEEILRKTEKLSQLNSLFDKLRENEKRLESIQEDFNNDKEEKFKVDRDIKVLSVEIEKYRNEVIRIEKELNEQKYLNLANELKSELKDGCPCPVCGSINHPSTGIVRNNEKISLLEMEKLKLENNIKDKIEDYDTLIRKQSDLNSKININGDSIVNIKHELGDKSSSKVSEEITLLAKEIANLKQKLSDWESSKSELEKEIRAIEEVKNKKEKEEIQLRGNINNKSENLMSIKDNISKIEGKYNNIRTKYMDILCSLKIDNAKDKVEEINKNSKIIEEIEIENNRLKKEKEEQDAKLKETRELFIEIDKSMSRFSQENEGNQKRKSESEEEFNFITKGANPKLLLENAADEIKRITSNESRLRVIVEEQKQKTEHLKSQTSEIKGKYNEANNKYKSLNENLQKQLYEYKFENIYAVKNNIIDDLEREKLKDKIEFFEKEEKSLSLEIANIKQKLNNRSVDIEEYKELKKEKYKLREDIDNITQQIGAKQNEVMTLEKNLKKVKELDKKLRQSSHTLDLLKEIERLLIGKRFVEFVAKNQLEYIVIEASKRLDSITKGRYALEIDDNLNFIMRDNYNGGLRRGIKTLSGGETFLTSLSLALALSSQIQLKGSAPLEFFFLDEGFGSLDTQLLDLVMESLEKLHSERLSVGIISHVEELKNRVPIKLIVTPNDGGNGSKINIEYS